MNSPDQILIPAIIVFGILVVGLILTVMEFNRLQNDEEKDPNNRKK